MRFGLALPQYDYSVPDEHPLQWETVAGAARHVESLGFDSLWLSDHLFLEIDKYGAGPGVYGAFEPIVTLAALARETSTVRLGTLVLCEALRPATVLAKALATLDRVSGGRLDVGIGAGWYEPEYAAIGLAFPPPGERLARLAELLEVLEGMLTPNGEPFTFRGRWHHAESAPNLPPAVQSPHPSIFIGGKGDRLLDLVARRAPGWNTCWVWTPAAYRERADVLARACERAGRDPATVTRTLGLYALAGSNERDLTRRYERLQASVPGGMLDGVPLSSWREGRLVGTYEEIRDQIGTWEALGVSEIIVGAGALPFALSSLEDVDALREALAPVASKK